MAVSLMENLSSLLAKYLLQEASLVSHFREDFESICNELESIKSVLEVAGVKRNSTSICNWLDQLEDVLDDAVDIVEECGSAARNFPYNLIFRAKMGRKIKKVNERITKIHLSAKYIKHVRSVVDLNDLLESNTVERLNASAHLLQKESPPVGMESDIEKITELILNENDRRVIAVVGVGGQGKTLLVQTVSKSQMVDKYFDKEHRFWVVVSQKSQVKNVFRQISSQMKPDDASVSTEDQIIARLNKGRCLFVFDRVWDTEHDLTSFIERLVQIEHKIVITSRHKKVAESFRDGAYIHTMSYLSDEHSWKLFRVHAFPDCPEHHLPQELKDVKFDPVLEKCRGLPLAIKTTAAYMSRLEWLPSEWKRTMDRLNGLRAMNDVVMPCLRLSYEALRNDMKPCFLFFSVFPKNIEIECQHLLNMWIAQGFISTQGAAAEYAYDVGRSYIMELIDRCLIEVSKIGGDGRVECCKIHDLLHDMAVSESLKQWKCFFEAGEQIKSLPLRDCVGLRRISVMKTDISTINDAIQSPKLRILLLSQNLLLRSISARFFNNLTYLTVLDLSYTAINLLPKSIGKLKHLKYLNLSWTNIEELPENLSGLRHLQFLDVSHCSDLLKLHSGIGKHKSMLYLNMESCGILKSWPVGISELDHLQTLKGKLYFDAHTDTKVLQLSGLNGLTGLQQLSLEIGVPNPSEDSIKVGEGTFGKMERMRTLSLNSSHPLELPSDMGVMARLEVVRLQKCIVPKWIFGLENLLDLKLEFDDSDDYKGLETARSLKTLHLLHNDKCTEFPKEFGEGKAFPKLEELIISNFKLLEKFPSLQDTAMPMLKYFRVRWCDKLKNMAKGIEKLKSLEEVEFLIKDDTPRAEDLWKGEWLHILKARQIKITVKDRDQSAVDGIVTREIAID